MTGVQTCALPISNGNYSIGVPPGWNGSLTPSLGAFLFVPGALSFTNVSGSLTNQNFLIVPSITPTLATSLSGTNLSLGWGGIPGVTYQLWSSPDLVNWTAYGGVILGTNGPMQLTLPVDPGTPTLFFRVSAAH